MTDEARKRYNPGVAAVLEAIASMEMELRSGLEPEHFKEDD